MTSPAIRTARTRWAFWASLGFGTPGITSSRRSIQSSSTRAITISTRPPAPFHVPTSLFPTPYLEPADLRCSNTLSRVPTAFHRLLTPSIAAFSRLPSLLSHAFRHCFLTPSVAAFSLPFSLPFSAWDDIFSNQAALPYSSDASTPPKYSDSKRALRLPPPSHAFHRPLTPSFALSGIRTASARCTCCAVCGHAPPPTRAVTPLASTPRLRSTSSPKPSPHAFHYLPLCSITFHYLPPPSIRSTSSPRKSPPPT